MRIVCRQTDSAVLEITIGQMVVRSRQKIRLRTHPLPRGGTDPATRIHKGERDESVNDQKSQEPSLTVGLLPRAEQ